MLESALAEEPTFSAEDDSVVIGTQSDARPHLLGLPQELRDMIIRLVYAAHDPIVRERFHRAPTRLLSVCRTLRAETEQAYNLASDLFWSRIVGRVPLEYGTSETHCFILELHANPPPIVAPPYPVDVRRPVFFEMTERHHPHEEDYMRCWRIHTPCEMIPDLWRIIGHFYEYPREGHFTSDLNNRFARQELVAAMTQAVVVLGSMRVSNAPGVKATKSRRMRSLMRALLWLYDDNRVEADDAIRRAAVKFDVDMP